jgi:hypothetical protein
MPIASGKVLLYFKGRAHAYQDGYPGRSNASTPVNELDWWNAMRVHSAH